jgi:threonine/homoserine/homoserine lactone efflux protein
VTPLALLAVAAVHALAAVSPGPSFVLSVRTAAAEGMRPALAPAAGFGLGAALWAAAALLGLALLFELAPVLLTAMKMAGGVFLVWMALRMWRDASEPLPEADSTAPRGVWAALRLGLFAFMANPKTAVFFGAVFVGLVPAGADALDRAVILFNIFVVETTWYALVAALFSRPWARGAYRRRKALLDRAFGAALGLLGIRIATL